jgi:hypothetical protein
MIRKAAEADRAQILALYKLVAVVPDGIARKPDEVTGEYVAGFMHKAVANGVELVWERGGRILGEIHASGPGKAACAGASTTRSEWPRTTPSWAGYVRPQYRSHHQPEDTA